MSFIFILIVSCVGVVVRAHTGNFQRRSEITLASDLQIRSFLSSDEHIRHFRRSGRGGGSGRNSPSRQVPGIGSPDHAYAGVSLTGDGRIHKMSGSKTRLKDVYSPRTGQFQASDPIHAAAGGATTSEPRAENPSLSGHARLKGNPNARTESLMNTGSPGNRPGAPKSLAEQEHVLKASAVGSFASTDIKSPPGGEGKVRVQVGKSRGSFDIPGDTQKHVEVHLPGHTNAVRIDSSVTSGGTIQAVGMNVPDPKVGDL